MKLSMLGGDVRQLAVARKLSRMGYETAVWGLEVEDDDIGDAVKCSGWEDALRGSKAIILPLPASLDGVYVNCTPPGCESIKMSRLLSEIQLDVPIIGGRFSPSFKAQADNRQIKVIDYFESETLQIKNAVPTAEGAVAIAMNELPITVRGCSAAVIGFGRIGRTLAPMLSSLGALVTVAARKKADIAWAKTKGYGTLRIEARGGQSSLTQLANRYDVIFNTVPHWLLDEQVLGSLGKRTLVIDLASAPGGIDMKAAEAYGIKVIWALSLPGKYAPLTAGDIICDSIIEILEGEGITV